MYVIEALYSFRSKIRLFEKILGWYVVTRKKTVLFMLALITTYLFLLVSISYHAPIEFITFLMFLTLLIPFSLVIMLLTDNEIYRLVKSKQWATSALIVMIATYSALSYIWASSEVNSIFMTNPGNLPWTRTTITVIFFFKNVVFLGATAAFIFALIYSNIWVTRTFITNYRGCRSFVRDILSGLVFILGLGLLTGSSLTITLKKEQIAKLVAVKADSVSNHNCKGSEFNNSIGIIPTPTGQVLVIKEVTSNNEPDWSFKEVSCNKQI